jgi:hypothetical protein
VKVSGPNGERPGMIYRFDFLSLLANSLPSLCN